MKRYLIFGALMALVCHQQKVCGQTVDWFTGGNTSLNPNTSFLGTTDGVPINFRTNNTRRLRLNNTVSYTIGPFAAQAKNGALGLCPDGIMWTTGPGPFSLLHLADATVDNMQVYGYRPWMRNPSAGSGLAHHLHRQR